MQTKLYTTIYIKMLHLSSWWQCLHCSLSFVAWPASVTSKKPKTKTDFTVYRLYSPNTLNDTNLSNVRKSLLMSLFFLLPSLTQLSPFPQQTNAMCCQIMCGLLAFKSLYVFTLICICTFFWVKHDCMFTQMLKVKPVWIDLQHRLPFKCPPVMGVT